MTRSGGILRLAADFTGVHHWRKDSALHQVVLCISLFAMYATLLLTAFVVSTDEAGPTGHRPFDLWTAMSIVILFSIEMLKDATTDMTKLLKMAATLAEKKEGRSGSSKGAQLGDVPSAQQAVYYFPVVEAGEIYESLFRMHFSELLQKLLMILALYSTSDTERCDRRVLFAAACLVPVFFATCLLSSHARIRCMADGAGPRDVSVLVWALLLRPAADIAQMALVVGSLHPMLGQQPEFDAIYCFDIAAFGLLAVTALVYARILPRALTAAQASSESTDASPLLAQP